MGKFKIGDDLIARETRDGLVEGQKYKVRKTDTTGASLHWVFLNGAESIFSNDGSYTENCFTLAPAPKFKVGDRVRDVSGLLKGNVEAVVRKVYGDEIDVLYDQDGDKEDKDFQWLQPASEFELIEPAPLFAVGDKVRLLDDNGGYGKKGDTGTIQSISLDDCGIEFDSPIRNGKFWYASLDNLEHATTDEEAAPKFKVGDKVEFSSNPTGAWLVGDDYSGMFMTGNVLAIQSISDGIYQLSSKNGMYGGTVDIASLVKHFTLVPSVPSSTTGFTIPTDEEALPPKVRYPFVFDGGKLTLDTSRLETVTAGIIRDSGNRWAIDLNEKTFKRFDNKPKPRPAIVALVTNGQPLPADKPKVHKSATKATKEANRLATRYPGQEFGVFELVSKRVATVDIREAA